MSNVAALLEANGWTLEQTGGGCTAWTKADDGSWYWMITRQDEPSAPELMSEPVTVGRYRLDTGDAADLPTDYATLQQWADSHYLQEPEACPRCGVDLAGPMTCPLHAAGGRMLEALRDLHRYITDGDWRCEQDQKASDATDGNVNAYELLTERAAAAIVKAQPGTDAGLLAAPPEPAPPHDCQENALRGNRCGICGAFLQPQ